MMQSELPRVLHDWVDAQNEHDAAKHAALYTEDGVLEDGAKNRRFTSRAVTFFELRGGLIGRSSDYYDSGAVLDRLGLAAGLLVGVGRAFGVRPGGQS